MIFTNSFSIFHRFTESTVECHPYLCKRFLILRKYDDEEVEEENNEENRKNATHKFFSSSSSIFNTIHIKIYIYSTMKNFLHKFMEHFDIIIYLIMFLFSVCVFRILLFDGVHYLSLSHGIKTTEFQVKLQETTDTWEND